MMKRIAVLDRTIPFTLSPFVSVRSELVEGANGLGTNSVKVPFRPAVMATSWFLSGMMGWL